MHSPEVIIPFLDTEEDPIVFEWRMALQLGRENK